MTYGLPPIIGGVTFRRPSSATDGEEELRSSIQLASGALRAYVRPVRKTYELTWSTLTEAEVDGLRSALSPAFVSYRHTDGTTRVVETCPVTAVPIAGTDPTRFGVTITLRAQVPGR